MSSSDSSDDDIVVVRRPRIFKERVNYEYTENGYEFNERFRLTSEKVEMLTNILGPRLQRETNRNKALSVKTQIQTALHWLGTGAQYHAVADMSGMSKASVCRIIKGFVSAVNEELFAETVKWPDNMATVVEKFFDIGGIPMVCGVVDGTLIKIDSPSENEAVFVDRHGNHSINCMVVCGPGLEFYYSYANWPGSAHDGRVLRNSGLHQRMEGGWRPIEEGIILGDSGYPLKEWLITPIVGNPDEPGNRRFLRSHKTTRRVIENAIGILKEKFPCLNHLRVDPIFNCCVTLCNVAREIRDDDMAAGEVEEEDGNFYEEEAQDARGMNRLQRIIEYFRN